MKEFFKDPINIIVIFIFLVFACFVIFMVWAINGVVIDHFCTYEISASEAREIPQCEPYLKYLNK